MKIIILLFTFFFQKASLNFQNENKKNILNDTEEKRYTIIRGYNYHSKKTENLSKAFKEKELVLCKTNLVPGLDWMVQGINLNTLDFFPFGPKASNKPNGFLQSIFEFTCEKKQKWKHKTINATFDFPDQIQNLREISTGVLDVEVSIKQSLLSTKNELSVQAGLGAGYAGFAFSASGAYKKAKECFIQKSKILSITKAHESAYEVELSDQLVFSHKFLTDLNKLPTKYEENPSKYEDIFDNYGTHYFVIGRFGGSIVLKSELEKSLIQEKSFNDIKGKLEANFFNLAKLDVEVSVKDKKIDSSFNERTESHFQYFGGSNNYVEKHKFSEWTKSVPLRPWLFSGMLKPIYNVIPDAKKAAQINIAMDVSFARTAVTDIQDSIKFLKQKYPNLKIHKSKEIEWSNVKMFFDISQKKFSFKDVEKNMKILKKIMKMMSFVIKNHF